VEEKDKEKKLNLGREYNIYFIKLFEDVKY